MAAKACLCSLRSCSVGSGSAIGSRLQPPAPASRLCGGQGQVKLLLPRPRSCLQEVGWEHRLARLACGGRSAAPPGRRRLPALAAAHHLRHLKTRTIRGIRCVGGHHQQLDQRVTAGTALGKGSSALHGAVRVFGPVTVQNAFGCVLAAPGGSRPHRRMGATRPASLPSSLRRGADPSSPRAAAGPSSPVHFARLWPGPVPG